MKHLIMGTAGHIDHGKTALIKALTGVDTDKLKEEKERGITIELGFASLALKSGRRLGIVDVPGHEKFVKNMVAGAGGMDLVVLVIAADEGVMPQTREHLDICALLGIKKGLVALTKIDLVDEEWIDLIVEDIEEFLKGTFMEGCPIVPISSVTGKGLPEFLSILDKVAFEISDSPDSGVFRLPVDRVFTMKGFGTVVTGTLMSGEVKVGEMVEILPGRIPAKVRGIQVHNETVARAEAGQRTAINLQGIEKTLVQRGNIIAHTGALAPSNRFDISFRYLPGAGRKLRNRALVRFHSGTGETISRIILIGKDEVEPGEEGCAQVLLGNPTAAVAGDRFVIRSYSPVTTIGGGRILDPLACKHKRHSEMTKSDFSLLCNGDDQERVSIIISRADLKGITFTELLARTGINPLRLEGILKEMTSKRQVIMLTRDVACFVSSVGYKRLQKKILAEIEDYHKKFPLKDGLLKEELRTTSGHFIDSGLFNMAVKDLEKEGKIVVDEKNVRIAGYTVSLDRELMELREGIEKLYIESGLTPPSTKELPERFKEETGRVESILKVLLNEGTLIKVSETMYFHRDVLERLGKDYRDLLLKDGIATPASFKDMTGISRKFIIPLMEYFDMTRLTIRVEDHRVLRERKEQ